mmetsp:Transcript_10040/g.15292  ORF Transcript_10040/g.15292 Transcript_10040/m.15292 type:complete len:208 (-) Transcript_10040:386-1009(-)
MRVILVGLGHALHYTVSFESLPLVRSFRNDFTVKDGLALAVDDNVGRELLLQFVLFDILMKLNLLLRARLQSSHLGLGYVRHLRRQGLRHWLFLTDQLHLVSSRRLQATPDALGDLCLLSLLLATRTLLRTVSLLLKVVLLLLAALTRLLASRRTDIPETVSSLENEGAPVGVASVIGGRADVHGLLLRASLRSLGLVRRRVGLGVT